MHVFQAVKSSLAGLGTLLGGATHAQDTATLNAAAAVKGETKLAEGSKKPAVPAAASASSKNADRAASNDTQVDRKRKRAPTTRTAHKRGAANAPAHASASASEESSRDASPKPATTNLIAELKLTSRKDPHAKRAPKHAALGGKAHAITAAIKAAAKAASKSGAKAPVKATAPRACAGANASFYEQHCGHRAAGVHTIDQPRGAAACH